MLAITNTLHAYIDLAQGYKDFFQRLDTNSSTLFITRNKFIAPATCRVLQYKGIQHQQHWLLETYRLTGGYIIDDEIECHKPIVDVSDDTRFKQMCLDLHSQWLTILLNKTQALFKTREVDGNALSNHSIIRVMFADVICALKLSQQLQNQEQWQASAYQLLSGMKHMIKLAGGRAVLIDNALVLHSLFSLFVSCYFFEEYSE